MTQHMSFAFQTELIFVNVSKKPLSKPNIYITYFFTYQCTFQQIIFNKTKQWPASKVLPPQRHLMSIILSKFDYLNHNKNCKAPESEMKCNPSFPTSTLIIPSRLNSGWMEENFPRSVYQWITFWIRSPNSSTSDTFLCNMVLLIANLHW